MQLVHCQVVQQKLACATTSNLDYSVKSEFDQRPPSGGLFFSTRHKKTGDKAPVFEMKLIHQVEQFISSKLILRYLC